MNQKTSNSISRKGRQERKEIQKVGEAPRAARPLPSIPSTPRNSTRAEGDGTECHPYRSPFASFALLARDLLLNPS